MNKVTKTGIKVSAIGIGGTLLSLAAAVKTTDMVYEATENINKATAAGGLVGGAGMLGTIAGCVVVADKDAESYTAEDMAKAAKVNRALDTASNGLKTVSNAIRLATCLSGK